MATRAALEAHVEPCGVHVEAGGRPASRWCAPLAWLASGALRWFGASLGPDPVKELEHECGKTALNLLLLTLAVTPVRELTSQPQLLRLRRMLGLFAFFSWCCMSQSTRCSVWS